MKKMINKVIAAAMMMAITAMPAMAGNKHHKNHEKKTTVVVVTNNHKASHFDKVDKRTSHFNAHNPHASRLVSRPARSESAVMQPTTMQWPRQSASTA